MLYTVCVVTATKLKLLHRAVRMSETKYTRNVVLRV
jgi:hypothetical protein